MVSREIKYLFLHVWKKILFLKTNNNNKMKNNNKKERKEEEVSAKVLHINSLKMTWKLLTMLFVTVEQCNRKFWTFTCSYKRSKLNFLNFAQIKIHHIFIIFFSFSTFPTVIKSTLSNVTLKLKNLREILQQKTRKSKTLRKGMRSLLRSTRETFIQRRKLYQKARRIWLIVAFL